jgi:hypothetical protein
MNVVMGAMNAQIEVCKLYLGAQCAYDSNMEWY